MTAIVTALVASIGIMVEARPSSSPTPATSAIFDREVRAARSYLEGWFGEPMVLPVIEVVNPDLADPSGALPSHYQDGVVRIRPETLKQDRELRRVLRHELTHAVIDAKTRGNCPHWLQEGIAQFLDGTDVVAVDQTLRREARLVPLFRIEGPFRDRDAATRDLAYRQSASAVSFLVGRIGRSGFNFILERLGEGQPFDRTLVEAGLTYAELQQAWESSLKPAPKRR